jgi:sporulation protein YlmC with PRC-barrel domain
VGELHLGRDLEDKRVVDRNGRDMGRVDRVVLEVKRGDAPRVVAIEIGPTALGARLAPIAGRIARALEHVFKLDEGRPVRIPIEQVEQITDTIKLDLTAGETAALAVEQRLRAVVRHFPGA